MIDVVSIVANRSDTAAMAYVMSSGSAIPKGMAMNHHGLRPVARVASAATAAVSVLIASTPGVRRCLRRPAGGLLEVGVCAEEIVQLCVGDRRPRDSNHRIRSALRLTSSSWWGGDENCPSGVGEFAQQRPQPDDSGDVRAVGRLVEQQDRWIADQGSGDPDSLAHAQRVAVDGLIGDGGEADGVQHLLDPIVTDPAERANHRKVPARGVAAGERVVVEVDAQVAYRLDRRARSDQGAPSISTVPRSGVAIPLAQRNRVDLPAPLRPSRWVNEPGATSVETLSRTVYPP